MKHNCIYHLKELSKSGYTPSIQVTTGTYSVTMYSTQSSGIKYSPSRPVKIIKESDSNDR